MGTPVALPSVKNQASSFQEGCGHFSLCVFGQECVVSVEAQGLGSFAFCTMVSAVCLMCFGPLAGRVQNMQPAMGRDHLYPCAGLGCPLKSGRWAYVLKNIL